MKTICTFTLLLCVVLLAGVGCKASAEIDDQAQIAQPR